MEIDLIDFYSVWFPFFFFFYLLLWLKKKKNTQMLSFEEEGFQLKPSFQVL